MGWAMKAHATTRPFVYLGGDSSFSSSTPSLLKPSPPLSRQPPTPQRRQGGAEIVVRIRLARFGCRNRPFYRVMAADSRSPRDGKHLEVLGYYNPLPGKDGGKRMGLKFDRVKYWLSVGAQPSDPVERLLFRTGILPPPPMLAMARKGGPRDRCPIDPMTGRPLDVEGLTIVDDTNTPGSEDEAPNEEAA